MPTFLNSLVALTVLLQRQMYQVRVLQFVIAKTTRLPDIALLILPEQKAYLMPP